MPTKKTTTGRKSDAALIKALEKKIDELEKKFNNFVPPPAVIDEALAKSISEQQKNVNDALNQLAKFFDAQKAMNEAAAEFDTEKLKEALAPLLKDEVKKFKLNAHRAQELSKTTITPAQRSYIAMKISFANSDTVEALTEILKVL